MRVSFWLCLPTFISSGFAPSAYAENSARPDLDVTYIERTPLMPAYTVGYDIPGLNDLPVLIDPQTRQALLPAEIAQVKRQPAPGDKVTFTAHVLNKGGAKAGEWKFQWLADDKPLKQGTHHEALMPAQEATETLEWVWQAGAHRIRFVADPQHEIAQVSQVNDSREVATDAWLFLWGVDKQTYDHFNALPNHVGTRSFEDWAQWHIEKMNQLFQSSPSPLAPKGSRVRVACNKIVVLNDSTQPWTGVLPIGTVAPADAGYDGAWVFGRSSDEAKWASAPDWGLIHEWGHQLGLTDENMLDRAGSQNLVRDESGDPLLIGYTSPLSKYLMHTVGPVGFSPVCMAALEAQYGKRRGYYGDYYFALPQTNVLIVADGEGKPVADARVAFWQDDNGCYQGEPAFIGTTDREGKYVLPNRPCTHILTENGFTLHDNPFGQVGVVGPKDVFLIRITARDHIEYAWLDVTEMNLAYWSGNKNIANFTRRTHIPATGAPSAPQGLVAEVNGDDVTLTWEAIGGAKSYRVYRAKPNGWEWDTESETVTDTVYKCKPGRSALERFAVAAVDANGKLSAFSNVAGAARLQQPWGIAITREGRRLIRDRSYPQALLQKPTGNFAGWIGPEALSLEDSTDIALDSKGRLISTRGKNNPAGQSGFTIQTPAMTEERSVLASPSSAPQHFQRPTGVAVDSHDNIFICDTDNDRIQEFAPDGKFKGVVGEGLLKQPMKLAVDKHDNLIVCDTGSDRLTVLRKDTDNIYRLHGHANNLPHPVYIAIDPDGRFFVSCQGDNSIVVLNNQFYRIPWKYTGPAGSPLKEPRGLAFSKGHLLVVDGGNRRILETPMPK